MRTVTTQVYTFDELSEEAKKTALGKFQDINIMHEWWDFIYDDAKNVFLIITEFDLDRGRKIKGHFKYSEEDTAKAIIEEHGNSTETYRTAEGFLGDIAPILYDINQLECLGDNITEKQAKGLIELEVTLEYEKREFEKAIIEDYLTMLDREYEDCISEERVAETIRANGYEFFENGKQFVQ